MKKMPQYIGLIHANFTSVQPMLDAFKKIAPKTSLLHFMDEGLLKAVNEQGGVTPQILRRFVSLLERAEQSGVDGILLSCSAFSPYVPGFEHLFSIPIVTVDGAMIQQAVDIGGKIGVIATVAVSGPITAQQIEEVAVQQGKNVKAQVCLATEAFPLLQPDPAAYNKILLDKAKSLENSVNAIVLAQISMSPALAVMGGIKVPVLTSPESSVNAILKKLGA